MYIYIRNDNDIYLKGLKDSRPGGGYLNAATVAYDLRTAKYPSGSSAATGTLTYVAGSNGCYVGGIDKSISLTEGTEYWLRITSDEGGVEGDWEEPVTAIRRIGRLPNR